MKTIRLVLILSLIALVTSACFRVEFAFIVDDDGSGVIRYQIAIREDVMAVSDLLELSDFGEVGESLNLTDEFDDLPPGAEVREYSEDGYRGLAVTAPISDFTDMEEVETVLSEVTESTSGAGDPISGFSINKDADGAWSFSFPIPGSEETGEMIGLDGIDEGMEGFRNLVLEDASVQVRIKLPGKLVEHNADRVEDGELVWELVQELDSFRAEGRLLTARTVPGDNLPIVPIIAGVAGVVVLAGLLSLAYVRRRK